MLHVKLVALVMDAGGQFCGYVKAVLKFTQQDDTEIAGDLGGVEPSLDPVSFQ